LAYTTNRRAGSLIQELKESGLLIGIIDARDPMPEGDRVDCGAGFDRVLVDPSTEDVVAGDCEMVTVG
jgi:hypothetical protein